ncbi:MAG TPA: C25 family cysteine peptidase [Candidatus Krumholzibacteria bacterium]|nr:C25 family cysteine peptidase [Candidatus Krumholzibacteria bacterium]HPD70893.1 C25 family cysteine peptidase [Candidatus Krumholzibacteria bacterium]HRY39407.1 C25 family cysteine peptidase [Candidatus Krumholzibacteria bacterium]
MIRSRAAARVPAGLALLVLVLVLVLAAGNVLAKDSPAVTTKAAGAGGLSLRVELPAAVEPWQTLVAVPAGKRVELSTAATGVSLGSPAVMHGVQVVPLVVQPDKSAPRGLDLDLAFVADPGAPRPQRQRIAATFARLIESQALGGAAVRQEFEEVPGTYLMIITSTTGAAAAVEPLLEWRRQQGYTVQAVTTQTTGTSTAQILAYIQQVYDTAEDPLAYVCLAGDANGTCPVATWHESVSGYNGEGDHYYTTLEGGDDLSDVHLGRLSARSVVELSNIVQKILRYEREPDLATDPGWYSRALLVGDQSSSGETTIYVNQWLKEELQHRGYAQIDTVFASPFASQITAKFNQGISAYAYRGYIGMSGFSTGYIDNLANAGELAFAIMPTCGSGSFAAATHTYSEAMLRNPTGAAIGAIGTATSGTHTRYNNCYFHGAWEGAVNERDRHLGYAHTRGKLELFRQYGVGEPSIPEIWSVWNNLMGDPATEMRQALPTVPVVTYPAVVPAAAGTIPVTVTRPGGEPLAGARVALYRDSSLRSSGVTGEAGEVLLPLPAGAGAGAVQVTVTGDDLFPHRGSLLIGAVTTYCVQDGWIWSDGADGMPDPGETADLTVQIRNLGDQAATAVVTSLAAASAGVQVAGGDVVVDSVPAGAVVPAGPWTVSLAADVPDGEDAILSLAAVAGGETWQSRVDLPVSAPAFVVDAIQWSGAPGWSGSLQVTLRNAGSTPAVGAVATFTTASGFLILTGPVAAALGNVPTAGTALAPFQLAVSADAWGGYLAPCALTVTTATGTRQVIELPLTVGVGSLDSPVGPGTLGYLAWDEQDPSPDAPVFWWREIDPNHGGAGTDVGLTDFGAAQDDTRTFDLPFAFRYHGADYDRISICSNGWAALGQTYFQDWRNWGLPAAGAPDPLLAPFWDDLLQSGTNRVYHDYDAAAGVYVVQWSRMRNDVNGQQNFELLLYDPLVHPTATGDGLIVFQYQQVTNNDSSRGYATAGIQDGPDGLTWTYFNRYATGARSLAAGRAIAWVPAAPAIPAAMSVSPASFSVVLEPDQTSERTLTIENTGQAGSILVWQLAVQENGGIAARGAGGRERTITVLAPNGGEVWGVGQNRIVSWSAAGGVERVTLQLDRGLGGGWETLASNLAAATGSWTWPVTGPASATCRVRALDEVDVLINDVSDGVFAIEDEVSWVIPGQVAGETPAGSAAQIPLTIDANGLAPGVYDLDLVVMSNGGAPVVVPVHLVVGTVTPVPAVAADLALGQNVPNPFNPQTVIGFALPRDANVRLRIHDLRGRLVRTLLAGPLAAGRHEVVFDGRSDDGQRLASGTYVYRLEAGGELLSRRLTLVK